VTLESHFPFAPEQRFRFLLQTLGIERLASAFAEALAFTTAASNSGIPSPLTRRYTLKLEWASRLRVMNRRFDLAREAGRARAVGFVDHEISAISIRPAFIA